MEAEPIFVIERGGFYADSFYIAKTRNETSHPDVSTSFGNPDYFPKNIADYMGKMHRFAISDWPKDSEIVVLRETMTQTLDDVVLGQIRAESSVSEKADAVNEMMNKARAAYSSGVNLLTETVKQYGGKYFSLVPEIDEKKGNGVTMYTLKLKGQVLTAAEMDPVTKILPRMERFIF